MCIKVRHANTYTFHQKNIAYSIAVSAKTHRICQNCMVIPISQIPELILKKESSNWHFIVFSTAILLYFRKTQFFGHPNFQHSELFYDNKNDRITKEFNENNEI